MSLMVESTVVSRPTEASMSCGASFGDENVPGSNRQLTKLRARNADVFTGGSSST
jgi:hypothetical protein